MILPTDVDRRAAPRPVTVAVAVAVAVAAYRQ
jgi:hypothetical protein